MTIYKADLRHIILKNENEVLGKNFEKRDEKELKAINDYLHENKLESQLLVFQTKLNQLKKEASNLREFIPGYNGIIYQVDCIKYVEEYADFINHLVRVGYWKNVIPNFNEIEYNSAKERGEIRDEHDKLRAQIKAISAKQGYELLKNLGFDVSTIDVGATKKNAVLILDIDPKKLGVSK
ncbi:gp35 [Listeria phage P40]|uniref:gp35 n=1 Tax=Listeria phage P40 TaxID=560178 RepID=UPI00018198E9|nr:gp35 [Listeria phage P40]ACI00395.1 gp35 [Listeria phage P40]